MEDDVTRVKKIPDHLRDFWLYKAKLAELAERFDEMLVYVDEASKRPREQPNNPWPTEHVIIVKAIDRRCQQLRSQIRECQSLVDPTRRQKTRENLKLQEVTKRILDKLRTNEEDACNTALRVLKTLCAEGCTDEAAADYYRCIGDIQRYGQKYNYALDNYEDALELVTDKSKPLALAHLGRQLVVKQKDGIEAAVRLEIPKVDIQTNSEEKLSIMVMMRNNDDWLNHKPLSSVVNDADLVPTARLPKELVRG